MKSCRKKFNLREKYLTPLITVKSKKLYYCPESLLEVVANRNILEVSETKQLMSSELYFN